MGLTDHTRSGKTALFRTIINSTKNKHLGTNGTKYQTTKTNSKELNTKRQNRKPEPIKVVPTTNYQCLVKTLRTINNGVSIRYLSEPGKTAPFTSFDQAAPTNQQDTNKTPTKRGRTNGRCTGNNTNCTQRCNISTKEDVYREHSSYTCTQEDNGGSHGCYQHTHPIDNTVVRSNGPFQGHHVQTGNTVVSPKGPFRGKNCSHTVRSESGPFQGHHVQTGTAASATKGPTNYT